MEGNFVQFSMNRNFRNHGLLFAKSVSWVKYLSNSSYSRLQLRTYYITHCQKYQNTTNYDQFEILNATKFYYENLYRKREQYLDTNDIIEQLSDMIFQNYMKMNLSFSRSINRK